MEILAHNGKIPKRIGGAIHLKKQISEMKETLKALIDQEEFEKAAEVRDEIRALEKRYEAQGREGNNMTFERFLNKPSVPG